MNSTQVENANLGNSNWQITTPALLDKNTKRTPAIEGYASLTSVNVGGSIDFYISAVDPNTADPTTGNPQPVLVEIFRMGYYNGLGGRLMASLPNLNLSYQQAPQPDSDGLIDCNWASSHTLTIPADWVSGVYVAKLTVRPDEPTSKQNYIMFVVREDGSPIRLSLPIERHDLPGLQPMGGWGTYESPGITFGSSVKVSFQSPVYCTNRWCISR